MRGLAAVTGLLMVLLSVAGALSLFVLVAKGMNVRPSPLGAAVAAQYEVLVDAALGWADRTNADVVANVNAATGSDFSLRPHWKHVFVLLWLYFGASVISSLGNPAGAAFRALWGSLVSLPTSVVASFAPLEDTTSPQIALSFILGLFAYGVGLAAWLATLFPYSRDGERIPWGWSFWYHLGPPFRMTFLAVLLLAVGDWAMTQQIFPKGLNFGLTGLVATMLLLGVYWVAYGLRRSSSPNVALGVAVLSAIGGAVLLFALFAALGSVGL